MTSVLERFRPCFTARGFDTFTVLITGLIVTPTRRTVCGMLTACGLETRWHHSRSHRFFATARWNLDHVGLVVLSLVILFGAPAIGLRPQML